MPSSNSWITRHRNGAFFSLVSIVVVAVVCAGVLAGVNYASRDAFATSDAALDEAQGGAQRALLFPEATSFTKVSAPAIEGLNSAYQANTGDWVFDVAATGYHGDVQLMVGIAADGTVAGIQIVSHTETDGIGTNALNDEYFGTYVGLAATGELTVDEAGSGQTHVDGVSGATFTSRAIAQDVSIAIEAYQSLGGN